MKKQKRPKTTTSMKSGGIDNNTLLIVIVIIGLVLTMFSGCSILEGCVECYDITETNHTTGIVEYKTICYDIECE